MQIDHIHIKNYRCFAELEVNFHPKLTVLVAENGQGKSTLLDSIKVALWPFVAGFDLGSQTKDTTGIHIGDVRCERQGPHDMKWIIPAQISAIGQMQVYPRLKAFLATAHGQSEHEDGTAAGWQTLRSRESLRKGTRTKDIKPINGSLSLKEVAEGFESRIFSDHQEPPDDLPVLGYYGTGRLWGQKSLTLSGDENNDAALSRTFAYRDCLDPLSTYKHFARWYERIFRSFRDEQVRNIEKGLDSVEVSSAYSAPIRAVQQATDRILKGHTGWHTLEYSVEYDALTLRHDQHGQLKVDQLSDGIRNMVAMVGDIAHRCYKLNAHQGHEAPRLTHGIVMIDEVDMHLHPVWQQTIVPDLMDAFPEIQFIVTTHSPQVLTTVNRDNIRILQATETGFDASKPDFSPLAHESGDALAKIMGAHREPELPLQNDIRRYEQWVRVGREDNPDAKQLRAELETAGYQFHDSDLATWRFLAARKSDKAS